MKTLLLALLSVALGAALLFLVVRDAPGERGKPSAAAPSAERGPATPRGPGPSAPREGARGADAGVRLSVPAAAAPPPRTVFEGTLIGEGAPLVGGHMSLLRRSPGGDELLSEAQSDGRGRFRLEFEGTPTGTELMRANARGYVTAERKVEARRIGGTTLLGNLRLQHGQRITGSVLDGASRPIADAEIRIEPISPGTNVYFAEGHTGPDGRFEIADAPPGTVQVTARARGFGEASVTHVPGKAALEIRLAPGSELLLRLGSPRGQPVTGAEVSIQLASDPRSPKRVAMSDAEGRVRFDGLAAPSWNVRVTHPDYRPSGRSQVAANGIEESIQCIPWPAIEGMVRAPGGAALPDGTRVQAIPAGAPGELLADAEAGLEVALDGHFRIGGLRAGDWRVLVSAPGYAPVSSPPVRLTHDADGYAGTIELVSGSSLRVRIRCGESAVPGAEVEILSTPPTPAQLWSLADARSGRSARAQSGADGNAILNNLPPGRVWVAVFAEGFPPASAGPCQPGNDGAPFEVALVRGGRVHGRVLGGSGAPIVRAELRLSEQGGAFSFPLVLVTDGEGRYTSPWLPPGRYALEAFAPDETARRSGAVQFELEAGEQRPVDLHL